MDYGISSPLHMGHEILYPYPLNLVLRTSLPPSYTLAPEYLTTTSQIWALWVTPNCPNLGHKYGSWNLPLLLLKLVLWNIPYTSLAHGPWNLPTHPTNVPWNLTPNMWSLESFILPTMGSLISYPSSSPSHVTWNLPLIPVHIFPGIYHFIHMSHGISHHT